MLAGHGFCNKQIANSMNVDESTAKAHLHQAFRKMGIKKRYELVLRVACWEALAGLV